LNSGLHNLHHFLSKELLVGSFGVTGGLDLFKCLLCESNAEHSEDVTISGLSLNESLNE